MDVFRDVVDRRDSGYPAVLPRAERRRELITTRWCKRMADEGPHGGHDALLDAEHAGQRAHDVRLGHAVLRRARTVRLEVGSPAQAVLTEQPSRERHGLR